MTRVPFRRQPNDWTCGPAALSMAFAAFGIRVGGERLRRELGTNAKTGTARKAMAACARRHGLNAAASHGRTLRDVDADLRDGGVVIALYTEPDGDEAHYAVVRAVARDRVRLIDPWNGPRFSLSRPEFLRRWHGTDRRWPRWALTVRPEKKDRP
jgi:ABC-type bacteriocin/lantibiotic exporter with double-glycine peptidase domain